VVGLVAQKLAGPSAFVSTDGCAAATGHPGLADRVEIGTAAHDPATQAAVADRARRALLDGGVAVQYRDPHRPAGGVIDGHVYAAAFALLVIAVVMADRGLRRHGVLAQHRGARAHPRVRRHARDRGAPGRGAPHRGRRGAGHRAGRRPARIPVAIGVTAALDLMVGGMLGGDPLPLRFSPVAGAAWLAVVLAGAVLATLPPARRAARLTVREALAYL
jgi:putative ABC transport system permease protein